MTKEELARFTEEEVRDAYLDMDAQLTRLMADCQKLRDDGAAEAAKLTTERDHWKAAFEEKGIAYAKVYEELQTLKTKVPQISPNPLPHDECG